MASVFKADGATKYTILYNDEHGKRRKKIGYTDKRESERFAAKLEDRAIKIKNGDIDPRSERFAIAERKLLTEHITDWQADLTNRGGTAKHADLSADRVRRLVAVMVGAKPDEVDGKRMTRKECTEARAKMARLIASARLSILTGDKVQDGLATFRDSDRSLETCNHYRRAIRGFAQWAFKNGRLRENPLLALSGFNAKEDRRHDRRTIALEELLRLIAVADRGATFMGMTGRARALCYRLAVATGLRYSELASTTAESFDWDAPSVTVAAAYTKNGAPATMPIPDELAQDLAAYVATLEPGAPVFPLPEQKGAKMLRFDLVAAKIPYRDAGGLVFDFHSLRCEMATLADAAGVTPRVVQKMMRHSTLELTGRYTRPRAVDIDAAADKLPSLRPAAPATEAAVMTGTDSRPVLLPATENATTVEVDAFKSNERMSLSIYNERTSNPKVVGSNPTGRAFPPTTYGCTSDPDRY
jgi:integrase